MKNLLAYTIALAMVLSSFITVSAADMKSSSDFYDASYINYVEAVDTMVAAGIIDGYPDGTFIPARTVKRAEMAKMITIMMNDGKDVSGLWKSSCPFADSRNHWAAGYIAYCASSHIIDGRSANVFDPEAPVTGTEAAKMALTSLGYDSRIQGYVGNSWAAAVLKDAKKNGLFNGLMSSYVPGDPCNRESAAQILYNCLRAGVPDPGTSYVPSQLSGFDPAVIPAYTGNPYVIVNSNVPWIYDSDLTTDAFEVYSPLDSLGRCGAAYANVCTALMPTEDRGSIGMIKPSGWQTVRYDDLIEDKYLYNRCHLIGYQLTGESDNVNNLITGTRYMNVSGMLPFENRVASYVKSTHNHVLYRVTPVFSGSELLCRGVLIEARSVEDYGRGIEFCVFCYNVQPGIGIDYSTGRSWRLEAPKAPASSGTTPKYVVNTNSMKFHYPSCEYVAKMSSKNRLDSYESRDSLISKGYVPCKVCKP